MELMEYKALVESKYGPVILPRTKEEIDSILETLDDSMESVSMGDYQLFQAMEVINAWRDNCDHDFERKNRTNDT